MVDALCPQRAEHQRLLDSSRYYLHYASVDDASRCIGKIGSGTLMAKLNLKAAFRMMSVQKDDWELLCIHWQDYY